MSLTFFVPPGIGDFSAMYSKLCGIKREIEIVVANDGPHRLMEFLEILPNVKFKGYGNFYSGLSLAQTLPPGTDIASLPDGEYFLAVNEWLEQGHNIRDWIPGETDYHYPMNIPENLKKEARDFMSEIPLDAGALIGVYCTSYSNSRHWGFWGPSEWFEFLTDVRDSIPEDMNPIFVMIGAEYDMGISETLVKMMLDYNENLGRAKFRHVYTVGRFHIGATIEIIKRLNYFFIFPSGLGFLADVVNTPNLMWFPQNLDNMRYTFSDPINRENGRTIHNRFSDPLSSINSFRTVGFKQMEESYANSLRYR